MDICPKSELAISYFYEPCSISNEIVTKDLSTSVRYQLYLRYVLRYVLRYNLELETHSSRFAVFNRFQQILSKA